MYRLVLARPISGRQASTRWYYKSNVSASCDQNGEGSYCDKTFSTRKRMRGTPVPDPFARLLVTERFRSAVSAYSHRMRVAVVQLTRDKYFIASCEEVGRQRQYTKVIRKCY